MAKCSSCPKHIQSQHGQASPKATRTSLEVCSELETALLAGQITIQSETLELISLPKRALCLWWMCIRRDEPEGFCGGGSGEIQLGESEGKAARAQGKVSELGWSQLSWKALGMEGMELWEWREWSFGNGGCFRGTAAGCRQGCLGEKLVEHRQGSLFPGIAARLHPRD